MDLDYNGPRSSKTIAAIGILMILGLGFLATPGTTSAPVAPSTTIRQAQVQSQSSTANATIVSINPPNITGISPGNTVTFDVNMSRTKALSSFQVTLQYDSTILNAANPIDYANGILGSSAFVFVNCVNAIGSCTGDTALDGPDKVTLGLSLLGTQLNDTSGLLFSVHFQVIGTGLSIVRIINALVALGGAKVPTRTVDGFFVNKDCGSQICRPLQMSLNFSATPAPVVGRLIRFNATITDPNPNSVIGVYRWSWDDASPEQNTTVPSNAHVYLYAGEYFVSVVVRDNYGIVGQISVGVSVGRLWIQLTVDNPAINPQVQVVAGTPVTITATAHNLSTLNETARIDIIMSLGDLGNKTLKSQVFPNMPIGQVALSYALDTTGLVPRAYRIFDRVELTVMNATLYQNDTSNSSHVDFLQIIQALSTASLSLFQAGFVGIAAVVGVNFAYIIFRRISRKSELDAESLQPDTAR